MKQLKLLELTIQVEIEESLQNEIIDLMAAAMLAVCRRESETDGESVEAPEDTP